MKNMMIIAFGLVAMMFAAPVQAEEKTEIKTDTTTVVVEPTSTEVVTEGQKTVVTSNPDVAADASSQTTVVVDPSTGPRDAITNEPVESEPTKEEDMSLRDKVRSKME